MTNISGTELIIHKRSHRHASHLQIWKNIQLRRPIKKKKKIFALFCQFCITGRNQSVSEWVGCECRISQITQICASALARCLLPFNEVNPIFTFDRLQTLKWPQRRYSLHNCVITVTCSDVISCLCYTLLARGYLINLIKALADMILTGVVRKCHSRCSYSICALGIVTVRIWCQRWITADDATHEMARLLIIPYQPMRSYDLLIAINEGGPDWAITVWQIQKDTSHYVISLRSYLT